MSFQFISVSPSKKQTIDKDLIKKFKAVQENELRTWRGVNIKFTSRPGNTDPAALAPGQCHTQGGASGASGQAGWVGNNAAGGMGIGGSMGSAMGGANGGLMNAQNCQTISGPGQGSGFGSTAGMGSGLVSIGGLVANANGQGARKMNNLSNAMTNFLDEQKQYNKIEEKRFRSMLDLFLKYRDWEEERIKIQLMQGNNSSSNGGQSLGGASNPDGSGQDPSQNNTHGSNHANAIVPNMEQYACQSSQQQQQNIQNNLKSEFVNFKALKDSSILIRDGQSTIYFQKGAILNSYMNDSSADMFFKLIKCEAKLLRSVLEVNGFQQTESHDWNILWSSQSYKQYIYDNLNEYQKINHYPNSFELTRKDRLCANIVKMQDKFGKEAFDIIPDTYNLPDEFADFYGHFHQLRQRQDTQSKDSVNQNVWIIKPTNSSQGKGIFIIDDISEVPIDEPCIVSRYVPNPLLINGLKFDVRIYVLITSMDPWRIYVYQEGLARFASEEYNAQNIKSNKFAHLTNYSINKKNEKFVQNQNADQGDEGHKWSLQALTKQFEQMGIDNDLLWSKIYDVIIKSLISVDSCVQSQLKKMNSKSSCFELLGFDVLIDEELKPWLVEVNLSPSLACDSPIDLKIKHGLFVDAMNLICLKKFDRRRENLNKMKQRAKNIIRAKSYQTRSNMTNPNNGGSNQKNSQIDKGPTTQQSTSATQQTNQYTQISLNNKQVLEKLQNIQPKYKDDLRETLQENFRKGGFLRIYPSKNSNIYDKYFGGPNNAQNGPGASVLGGNQGSNIATTNQSTMNSAARMSNKILYKFLYSDEIIPYPNHTQIKKFHRTFSRYQHLAAQTQSNQSSSNSIAGIGNLDSKSSILNEAGAANGNDNGSTLGNQDYLSSNKKSFQKLGKIQGAKGSLTGHQLSHQNQHTPQKLYMGKRGEKGGAAQQFERQGKQQLLPALNHNSSAAQGGQHQSQNSTLKLGQQANSNSSGSQPSKKEKLLITGDDILIEYVARLMIAVKSIKENMLKAQWIYQIEKFIKHSVWHGSDVRRAQNNKLWQRLESRLIEMKERRKRLLQSLYKKELKTFQEAANNSMGAPGGGFSVSRQAQQAELEQFQKEYKFREEQKNVIIQGFSAQQLEDMLHTSTKNVAYEVISCLIWIDTSGPGSSANDKIFIGQKQGSGNGQATNGGGGSASTSGCKGVLTDIIKWLTMTNQHQMLNDVEFSILDQISTKQNRFDNSSNKRHNNSLGNKNLGTATMKSRKNYHNQGEGIRPKYNNTYGQSNYLGQQIEDETESYQQQISRSGIRAKHQVSQKSNQILMQQDDEMSNPDLGPGDQGGQSFKKLEIDYHQNKERNPTTIGVGAGLLRGQEGSDLASSIERGVPGDGHYRNIPTPNTRHQLNTPSLMNSSNKIQESTPASGPDTVSTAVYEIGGGALQEGSNSNQYPLSSSNSKLYDSSGASSGLKSLQGTAKKNRIIINDDLRSQHLREQQQIPFQSKFDQNLIHKSSTMNSAIGDGVIREKDHHNLIEGTNFTVDNSNFDNSDDLDNSTSNKIFGPLNDLNVSNREHILVSDLSANDDSQSQYNKDHNIDMDNINVHDLGSDILQQRHHDSFKPVKKSNSNNQANQHRALTSKVNTIDSELTLKSGDDYKVLDVNFDHAANNDEEALLSESKLQKKNQGTFDSRRKNSKAMIADSNASSINGQESHAIAASKSAVKVSSNFGSKKSNNQKNTIVLSKNMINFSANSQNSQSSPSATFDNNDGQDYSPQKNQGQIKSQLVAKSNGQQQSAPQQPAPANTLANNALTNNASSANRNKQQRQTPKNCRSKLTSHTSAAKQKNKKNDC